MSNLAKRSIAALILGPLVIYVMYIGGYAYKALLIALFFIAMWEWVSITSKIKQSFLWYIFGFFYLSFAISTMYVLQKMQAPFLGFESVPKLLFLLTALVWISDIFSYVFGKLIGGPKLAPSISPGKTWSGAIGGVIACVVTFFIMNYVYSSGADMPDRYFYIALGVHILVPIIALVGDLFESYLKRLAGVKDSGKIIPGHGGILDRIDGLLLVMNSAGFVFFIIIAIRASQKAAEMGAHI